MDTKFTPTRTLSVLAFVMLGVLAAPAFSQSTEYRRGYDQGYRDGAEAASAQAQPGGMGRIVLVDAIYGTRGASCNALNTIQQTSGRRRHLEVKANNDLCGDPAPGQQKRLSITYRCGDGPEQRVAGREGTLVAMSCR